MNALSLNLFLQWWTSMWPVCKKHTECICLCFHIRCDRQPKRYEPEMYCIMFTIKCSLSEECESRRTPMTSLQSPSSTWNARGAMHCGPLMAHPKMLLLSGPKCKSSPTKRSSQRVAYKKSGIDAHTWILSTIECAHEWPSVKRGSNAPNGTCPKSRRDFPARRSIQKLTA